jgi:hypothetical protein
MLILRRGCLGILLAWANVQAEPPTQNQLEFVQRQQRLLNFQIYEKTYGSLPANYWPSSGNIFEIESYWVPAERVASFQAASFPLELRHFFIKEVHGQQWIRFLVHPWSIDFYRDFLRGAEKSTDRILATPTASARTLLVWSEQAHLPAFFAKLSLAAEISGIFRCITGEEIARSIGTMQVLEKVSSHFPQNFHFFPEVFGVMPNGMERGGYIIRLFPSDISDERLKKFFLTSNMFVENSALNGKSFAELGSYFNDYRGPERSDEWQEKFDSEVLRVTSDYLVPFTTQWVDLLLLGIVTNPHGQNLYMELNEANHFRPTGEYLHQDFGDFSLDLSYLQRLFRFDVKHLPQIYGLERDYRQSEIQNEIIDSIGEYFKAGTLLQLAHLVDNQTGTNFALNYFRVFLSFEIMREVQKRIQANIELQLKTELDWLPELAERARQLHLSQQGKRHCTDILVGLESRVQFYRVFDTRGIPWVHW